MKKENWEKTLFQARGAGKITKVLALFYGWCKTKKKGVFTMPEGSIYTPEALKELLKSEKELSYKQGVKEEREKWEKKTITIPKGKTHPVHDKCEECIQIGKEQGVKETVHKIGKEFYKRIERRKKVDEFIITDILDEILNNLKKSIKC